MPTHSETHTHKNAPRRLTFKAMLIIMFSYFGATKNTNLLLLYLTATDGGQLIDPTFSVEVNVREFKNCLKVSLIFD